MSNLKRFAGTFRRAQTLKLGGVDIALEKIECTLYSPILDELSLLSFNGVLSYIPHKYNFLKVLTLHTNVISNKIVSNNFGLANNECNDFGF